MSKANEIKVGKTVTYRKGLRRGPDSVGTIISDNGIAWRVVSPSGKFVQVMKSNIKGIYKPKLRGPYKKKDEVETTLETTGE